MYFMKAPKQNFIFYIYYYHSFCTISHTGLLVKQNKNITVFIYQITKLGKIKKQSSAVSLT